MATHFRGPLLGARGSSGSQLFENLLIKATEGSGDIVTTFDDFNWVIPNATFGDLTGAFRDNGWVTTDGSVAPTNDLIGQNNNFGSGTFESCLRLTVGDVADSGGNIQLFPTSGGVASAFWPHIWWPEVTAGAAILDNTILVFACRVGLLASAGTAQDCKAFIGYALGGDTSVMTAATGALSTDSLYGFHINGDAGSTQGIFAIGQRTAGTAYAEGTNRTLLYPATELTAGHTATVVSWYDLAFRIHITDMSASSNGSITFYTRKPGSTTTPGLGGTSSQSNLSGWREHSTKLLNQSPNTTTGYVPTIEVLNGGGAVLSVMLVDWWGMGMSRWSRSGR